MDAELKKPIDVIFKVFKTMGMWQDGKQTWRYFICGSLFHIFTLYLFLALALMHMISADNLVDFASSNVGFTCCLTVALKGINFFVRVRKVDKLIASLESLLKFSADKNHPERVHVKKEVDFAFKIYKVFLAASMASCITAMFIPFLTHELSSLQDLAAS
jgi:hypothetical protein